MGHYVFSSLTHTYPNIIQYLQMIVNPFHVMQYNCPPKTKPDP